MQHTDDIDPAIERQVEDNVPPERKTAYAWRQFVAGTTHHRLHCEYLEPLVEAIYPAICRGDTVIGNVVPDFEDIRLVTRGIQAAVGLETRRVRAVLFSASASQVSPGPLANP